jgi:hypothetical protein
MAMPRRIQQVDQLETPILDMIDRRMIQQQVERKANLALEQAHQRFQRRNRHIDRYAIRLLAFAASGLQAHHKLFEDFGTHWSNRAAHIFWPAACSTSTVLSRSSISRCWARDHPS